MKHENQIYLDHAAGTFLLPEVKESIGQYLGSESANPSSIHTSGRKAAAELDKARQDIARVLDCKPSEIIFTSGGTEANNLAIRGLALGHPERGRHIITCETEHASVLANMAQLELEGYRITTLNLDVHGQVDLEELEAHFCDDTCLVSLMWVNNEIGIIHPIQKIAQLTQSRGIPFHCDAVQAMGHLSIDVNETLVDALTLSGHKIGCPAGVGVLYLRKGTTLQPLSQGGSQENNLRGGTQNLLGAISLSTAMRYHQGHLKENRNHFTHLQDHLLGRLENIPGIQINRGENPYSPHIISCSIHNVDGEALFIRLDMSHINVSNGSACTSGSQAPSHVLTSLGFERSLAKATLRISLGIQTTLAELDHFCDELDLIVHSINRKPR